MIGTILAMLLVEILLIGGVLSVVALCLVMNRTIQRNRRYDELDSAAPLAPVGLYTPAAVELVHHKVRNLVRHRIAQVFLEVLAKYPGVVANPAASTDELEHAGSATAKIKQDRHLAKPPSVNSTGAQHIVLGRGDNPALLRQSDRFYHGILVFLF